MIDYTHYLEEYRQEQKNWTHTKYIQKFINLAQSRNTPLHEWTNLLQEHKNQLGRGLTKNTQNNYNHQVKQFIKWCIKKEQHKTQPFPSHKKTHLTPTKIYKTLKDLKGE